MNLQLIENSIIEDLRSRGIACNTISIWPALIVDKLLEKQINRNRFGIEVLDCGIHYDSGQDSDYNILFITQDVDPLSFFDDKKASENYKAVTTFLGMNGTPGVKIFTGKRYNKELLVIRLSFIDKASMIHVTSLLPAILKNVFTEESVKTNKEFLKSLSTAPLNDCIDILIKQCNHIDFEGIYRRQLAQNLSECFKYQSYARAQRIDNEIEELRSELERLDRKREECVNQLNEHLYIQSHGNDDNDHDENILIDYLLNNKQVEIVSTCDNMINLAISTYLLSYDELAYESCVESGRTDYFYDIPSEHYEKMKKLCHEIFVDQKYRIRSKTYFVITIDYISKIESLKTQPDESEHRIISPHAYYSCHGNFPSLWDECLKNQNYIGAIDYMTSFAGNINWSDGTVSRRLINSIYRYECIEDADGNIYSGKELIKKEDGNENQRI